MGAGEWVASGIAFGALGVAIIALVFSARSANASQASAQASKSSADTSARHHILELALEGIVEFGPWRAEAVAEGGWRFFNVGDETAFGLTIEGLANSKGWSWGVTDAVEVPPGGFAGVSVAPGARGQLQYQIEARWHTGSSDGPESARVVWLRRPLPRRR